MYDLGYSAPEARVMRKRCPEGAKTADGVRQFGQKHGFCPEGVRSREATPKQSSWGEFEATW